MHPSEQVKSLFNRGLGPAHAPRDLWQRVMREVFLEKSPGAEVRVQRPPGLRGCFSVPLKGSVAAWGLPCIGAYRCIHECEIASVYAGICDV